MSSLHSEVNTLIALPYEMKYRIMLDCGRNEIDALCSLHSSFAAICASRSFWVEVVQVHRPNFVANPNFHTMALLKQLVYTLTEGAGSLYMAGAFSDQPTNIPVPIDTDIISVCCIHGAIYAKRSGEVYGFGANSLYEQGLGPDSESEILFTTKNPTLHNIIKVSSKTSGAMFLDDQGKVYITGYISSTLPLIDHPTQIPSLNNIVDIASGLNHYVCLDSDGSVYVYHVDLAGPTKIPQLANIIQIDSSDFQVICLDALGQIYIFAVNSIPNMVAGDGFAKRVNLPNIKQVTCGSNNEIFLDKDGNVFISGHSVGGRLGGVDISKFATIDAARPVKILSGISKIFSGNNNIFCVTPDGDLLESGTNLNGQLGLGNYDRNIDKFVKNEYISNIIFISSGSDQVAFIVKPQ